MIRSVIPVVNVDDDSKHFPLGAIAGRLDDWPMTPGWMDLPKDDERYADYSDWKVDW